MTNKIASVDGSTTCVTRRGSAGVMRRHFALTLFHALFTLEVDEAVQIMHNQP